MSRNMTRRIELAWPVQDPVLRQRIIDECLIAYLHDARDAWDLSSDGQYHRVGLTAPGPAAQQALMQRYSGEPAAG
jgi:polyphosphate kinase